MKSSLIIIGFFCLGLALARIGLLPMFLAKQELSLASLWLLMLLIGLSIGGDSKLRDILALLKPKILLLPLGTTIGTYLGAAFAWLCLSLTLADCLAVGAGFGYYSLSSIFITQYKGPDLGAIALIANVLRETIALLLIPWLCRICGPAAAISTGGATTMDTTLPVIVSSAGNAWIVPAIIHATCLDFSVPLWVSLFCSI